MATKSDLKAVLDASARAVAAAQPAAEQLDLLPSVRSVPLMDADAVRAFADGERKRGRPKGSEGLANRQLREMITRLGGNPLLNMARWAALEPEELAMRLGISKAEAFDRLMAINDKLAPYTAAKLAQTDEDGKAVPGLMIAIGEQGINTRQDGRAPWLRAFETIDGDLVLPERASEQNQGLSDDAGEKSNAEKSNGEG